MTGAMLAALQLAAERNPGNPGTWSEPRGGRTRENPGTRGNPGQYTQIRFHEILGRRETLDSGGDEEKTSQPRLGIGI
jgi:hypothetical protein